MKTSMQNQSLRRSPKSYRPVAADPLLHLAESVEAEVHKLLNPKDPQIPDEVLKSLRLLVSKAIHTALDGHNETSHRTRMELLWHLASIEKESCNDPEDDPLLSTAEAARLLGFSRPYVAMLIDQGQLKGATVSAGGHRRVPRSSVLEWQRNHKAEGSADYRKAARNSGMYEIEEAEYLIDSASKPK